MMRTLAVLLVALILLAPVSARSEAPERMFISDENMGGYGERVKLRAGPSTSARVLGQYFAGVEMDVYSVSNGWAKVSIGGREGYMMRKFLAPIDDAWRYGGEPGFTRYAEADGMVTVFDAPKPDTGVVCRIKMRSYVYVLGTIDEDWLHIAMDGEDGAMRYGYASSLDITQTDNMAGAVVDAHDGAQRVNIREEPSRNARVIGQYFSGVELTRLFDDHVVGDDWDRVRCGSIAGYIMMDFLDHSSGGCNAFRPPMTTLKSETTPLYTTQRAQSTDAVLHQDDAFQVLGIFGDRYQVRVEQPKPFTYEYGFIDMDAVAKKVTQSPSTTGIMLSDQALYRWAEDAFVPTERRVRKGHTVYVYGSSRGGDPYSTPYIASGSEWLYIDVHMEDGSWTSAHVPVAEVDFDEGLLYPEIMTPGASH